MFLSHQSIENCLDSGQIIIGPEFEKKNIRPVGIRVHLGKKTINPRTESSC